MFERCREHGIPAPVFEEFSGGGSVQFIFAEPIGPRAGAGNVNQKFGKKTQVQSTAEKVSKRQLEILNILEEFGELKSSDIIHQLLEPPAQRTLKKDLFELKKLGLINSRGQARATTWLLIKKD